MGRFYRRDGNDVHHHHHHHHNHDHHHGHDHCHGHNRVHLADPDDTSHGGHLGYEVGVEHVAILEDIFSESDHRTEHNHELLAGRGMEATNLMSSPGSGKTALLEKMLTAAQGRLCVGIIEGDIETALDANRLEGYGTQISLLNTGNGFGGECHLDTPMAPRAFGELDLSTLDLIMIRNVGNPVCPAESEVGETRKAMTYSLTEGENKSVKYLVMFRSVQVVVTNKMDLAPYLDFGIGFLRVSLEKIDPGVKVIEVSARTGEGIDEWLHWVDPALVD